MYFFGRIEAEHAFFNGSTKCDSSRHKIICVRNTKAAKIQSKKTRIMIINLYIDGDEAEVLTALAEHDDVTIEDKANELFNDLIARIWRDLREEFYS